MLFIIIPSVILCAVLIYQYLFCIRVYYIGQSLHKFRELRCEVILSLAGNVKKNYAINESIEHQLFLLRLNAIIKYLDAFGPQLLQFKSVQGVFSKIISSTETLTTNSKNTTIPLQYKGKVRECLFTALKAIPFLRFRFFIFFFKILAKISIKLGTNKYKQQLNALEKIAQFEKDKTIPCNS
jgi:hypothetical protein